MPCSLRFGNAGQLSPASIEAWPTSGDELTTSRLGPDKPSVLNQQFTTRHAMPRPPCDFNPLVGRVVDRVMQRCVCNLYASLRIPHDDIRISTDGNRSLARVKSVELRRAQRRQLHKLVQRQTPFVDAVEQQRQARLEPRNTVWNVIERDFVTTGLLAERVVVRKRCMVRRY